jgi:hypothetical protein
MATLEDLEARVAALEAERVDYKAVLAVQNALRANQLDHTKQLERIEATLSTRIDGVDARLRSIEEGQAELKDLLVRALDK